MVNGSSCPTCGWMLRWLPEQHAWGCDRCRKLVAGPQAGPPQGPPPQQPAGFAPPQGPPPGAPPQGFAPPPQGPPPQQPPQGFAPPPQPSPYAPPGPGAPSPSPYAPHGGPAPGPYSPHPPGHGPGPGPGPGYAMPPPGPRRSNGLAIGLAAGGLAVAGVVVAIVLATRGGGGGGGGAGSRDDLVKTTLAAMSAGDVDKLVKLGDPILLEAALLDCSERDKRKDKGKDADGDKDAGDAGADKDQDQDQGDTKDEGAGDDLDDPQIASKRLRRRHERLVEKTKGMKIELISIAGAKDQAEPKDQDKDKDAERKKGTRKGDEITKGCVLKTDVELHELVAKVKVTEPDAKEPSEGEATLSVLQAGGSWYLLSAPVLSAGGGAIGAKLRKYRDQMCACKDAACTEEVHQEMKDWAKTVRDEAKRLPADEMKKLDEIDDEMKACRRKISEGDQAALVQEAITKFEGYKTAMCACADRACAERVHREMEEWSRAEAARTKDTKPSDEDTKKLMALATAYGECQTKAMAEGATGTDDPMPPEDPDPSGGGASGGGGGGGGGGGLASIPACVDYRKMIDKLGSCPKYPRTSVESLKKGYDAMDEAVRASPSTRDTFAKSCADTVSAMQKIIDQICP